MTEYLVTGAGTLHHLTRRLPKGGPISLAVAYATSEEHLPLNPGDRVVLNASDAKVAAGSVDPLLVARWLRRGVAVYSHDSLHAKVIVRRGWAAIGSANWTIRADSILQEASWVSNDPAIVAAAEACIDRLIAESLELDFD